MAITAEISNYDDVIRGLDACQKKVAKGTKRVLNDLARRGAKTVVGKEASKVYNIKSGDVGSKFTGYKVIDSVTLAGVSIETYELTWKGRNLTPTHFDMSATKRGIVKWKPLKAKIRLQSTDYPQQKPFVAKGLPWTRTPSARARKTQRGWSGLPVDAVRSHLSVPQMIDNEKVNPNIEREIRNRIEQGLAKISL